MFSPALLSMLLAQVPEAAKAATDATGADGAEEGSTLMALGIFATVLAVLIVPFLVGNFLAKSLRTPELGGRMGAVIFALLAGSLVVGFGWPPKLGVDLKGGVILTYEIADEKADRNALIVALGKRINPSGTKEIVIRPYGPKQIEIIIPEVDEIEVRRIQDLIERTGSLEFRIVANQIDHSTLIKLAKEQAKKKNPMERINPIVTDGTNEIGRWVRAAREVTKIDDIAPFKLKGITSYTLRDGATGKLLDDPLMPSTTENQVLEKWLLERGITNVEVLVYLDTFNVTGDMLAVASAGFDENAKPSVKFTMSARGGTIFGAFTHANRPTDTVTRQLGIVLDNTLETAPSLNSPISTSGEITGSFTREEVDSLVNILRAGKLPSSLLGPTSKNEIGSLLGIDTINKGAKAIVISLVLVLVFIAFYYRFSGVVACLALLLNLVLILAILILFQQPLTLPGLAGLVLTVGMSVDANVLIFERIREEVNKGAALRMAIRNGFGRATTTIVDANVTTLITAIVLYAIGTDQIKGFAVTLIVGILMSMFTAIFCSRVVFELAERKRWVTQLSMMEILGGTQIDFIGKRKVAALLSCVLIAIGLIAVGLRLQGGQIFDIDFRGGTAVTMMLNESMNDADVREKLTELFEDEIDETSVQFNLSRISVEGQPEDRLWKLNTSLEDIDLLKDMLKRTFPLATRSMDFTNVKQSVTGDTAIDPDTTPPAEPEAEPKVEEPKTEEPKTEEPKTEEPKTEEPKTEEPKTEEPKAEEPKAEEPKAEEPKAEEPKAEEPKAEEPKAEEPKAEEPKAEEPKAEEPKAEEPKAEEPKADEPKAEEPKAEEPKAEEPKAEEPKAEEPKAEEPKAEEPKAEEPKAEEPKAEEPKAEEPKTDEPKGPEPPQESAQLLLQDGDLLAQSTEAALALNSVLGQAAGSAGDGSDEASTVGEAETEGEGENENENEKLYQTTADLEFSSAINYKTLEDQIVTTAKDINYNVYVELKVNEPAEKWTPESPRPFKKWTATIHADEATTTEILTTVRNNLMSEPVWHAADKIGSQVAGKTRSLAIWALFSSLLGIVAYIWIRFQKVEFGLAAVVALVHDVLITLGAIAISYWLSGALSFLQIEEFKISLPVVAAFLTIIGYSLNDTIVVFDRIREVRGKTPELTEEMINTSINQTLGRTLLTSLTTLIVVLILYASGGQSIHGFSFALLIGVLVGTYSSIFVASPATALDDAANCSKGLRRLTKLFLRQGFPK